MAEFAVLLALFAAFIAAVRGVLPRLGFRG